MKFFAFISDCNDVLNFFSLLHQGILLASCMLLFILQKLV